MSIKIRAIQRYGLCLALVGLWSCGAFVRAAQAPVLVREVDWETSYGIYSGRLVMVTDQMVFVEQGDPRESFAIARSEIRFYRTEGRRFIVETLRPLHTRIGTQSIYQFTIRSETVEPLMLWAGARQPAAAALASTQQAQWTYVARHKHGLGNCTGNLLLGGGRLTYEALDDREHTRQWLFKDIYRTRRRSPYRLEVETRSGEKYNFELQGKGMDIGVYRQLQNWLRLARRGSW